MLHNLKNRRLTPKAFILKTASWICLLLQNDLTVNSTNRHITRLIFAVAMVDNPLSRPKKNLSHPLT